MVLSSTIWHGTRIIFWWSARLRYNCSELHSHYLFHDPTIFPQNIYIWKNCLLLATCLLFSYKPVFCHALSHTVRRNHHETSGVRQCTYDVVTHSCIQCCHGNTTLSSRTCIDTLLISNYHTSQYTEIESMLCKIISAFHVHGNSMRITWHRDKYCPVETYYSIHLLCNCQ